MNRKFIWLIIIALAVGAVWIIETRDRPVVVENDLVNDNDQELTLSEGELERLPQEVEVSGRTVVIDRESVQPESREEYAELPFELEIGDESRLIEARVTQEPGESPVEFAGRALQKMMPSPEELEMYPETMYQYSASIHPMTNSDLSEHPAADDGTTEPAEEGLSLYIRAMNFPDDSVGGSESRFDFIVSAEGSWVLVWQGDRNFCRRPDQEYWTPASELCP